VVYHVLANLVLMLHAVFVAFVVFGALLVAKWRKLIWIHLIAVAWGVLIEFAGIICPLTPLEVRLRRLGGDAGYEGDFIEHYVTQLLYPTGLTREIQIWLGLAALLLNVLTYSWLLTRRGGRRGSPD
jgi:uncharacterized protein DUF2784